MRIPIEVKYHFDCITTEQKMGNKQNLFFQDIRYQF